MKFICPVHGEFLPKDLMFTCPVRGFCTSCGKFIADAEGHAAVTQEEFEQNRHPKFNCPEMDENLMKALEATLPKVLNKYKDYIPEDAVYIGRPSKWGNPFVIGKDGTREQVIAKYREYLLANLELVAAAQTELRGKDLVCFCAPKMCHGDVLMEVIMMED